MTDRTKKQAKRARQRQAQRQAASPAQRDAAGRVHLVVQRDAENGELGLGLSAPLFADGWQNQVALGAANTVRAGLANGATAESASAIAEQAMAGTSKLVDGFLARATDRQVACGAGCSHCCYQSVSVSAPEAFAIYDYLQGALSPDQLVELSRRIVATDERTRGLAAEQRLSPDLPCPFLEGTQCSIYAVRPLPCRGMNSLDATACERALHDVEVRARYLDGTAPLPCFVEPIRAFHAVSAGMQLALHQFFGLHAEPLELTAAMRVLFDTPDAVRASWLAGNDPFHAARSDAEGLQRALGALSGRLRP
ncbi:MAG: YkgJ family cysteine cluster protein [Polyangiaceae bacterium]